MTQDQKPDPIREAFEAWFTDNHHDHSEGDQYDQPEPLTLKPDGTYHYENIEESWRVWQAAQKPLIAQLKDLLTAFNAMTNVHYQCDHATADPITDAAGGKPIQPMEPADTVTMADFIRTAFIRTERQVTSNQEVHPGDKGFIIKSPLPIPVTVFAVDSAKTQLYVIEDDTRARIWIHQKDFIKRES